MIFCKSESIPPDGQFAHGAYAHLARRAKSPLRAKAAGRQLDLCPIVDQAGHGRSAIITDHGQGKRSMLKSIDPLLNADVLHALRSMGHGDDVVLCDTNFPADTVARHTTLGRVLRIDNVSAPRAVRAVLSVLPLDTFVDKPVSRMEVVGNPSEMPIVLTEVQSEIDAAHGQPSPMCSVERFAFYELAKKAYCVIQTGERRFYGNVIIKKGVIPPEAG